MNSALMAQISNLYEYTPKADLLRDVATFLMAMSLLWMQRLQPAARAAHTAGGAPRRRRGGGLRRVRRRHRPLRVRDRAVQQREAAFDLRAQLLDLGLRLSLFLEMPIPSIWIGHFHRILHPLPASGAVGRYEAARTFLAAAYVATS